MRVIRGRATYSRFNFGFHGNRCSHDTAYEIRFDLHGWFITFIFGWKPKPTKPPEGWTWWGLWVWGIMRHPRAYRFWYHMARYNFAHRKCDTADFHHSLGCDITPERELG